MGGGCLIRGGSLIRDEWSTVYLTFHRTASFMQFVIAFEQLVVLKPAVS